MFLKIGIPKGRLKELSEDYFKIKTPLNGDKSLLSFSIPNSQVEFYYLRPWDIVTLVSQGTLDFGVVSLVEIAESGKKVKIIKKLRFGSCNVVLAAPKQLNLKKMRSLKGLTIATSFPKITRDFFQKLDIKVDIFPARGSIEVFPKLGLADAVVDITDTGRTLRENGLKKVKLILKSEAVLISNKYSSKDLNRLKLSQVSPSHEAN